MVSGKRIERARARPAHAQLLALRLVDEHVCCALDAVAADDESGSPICYTIRGANLLVYPPYTGDVTLAYTARFTQLSGSVSTNSILALFPDAYLNGSLAFACAWLQDDAQAQKYGGLFDQAIGRIRKYMLDYKYPDTLQMRVA